MRRQTEPPHYFQHVEQPRHCQSTLSPFPQTQTNMQQSSELWAIPVPNILTQCLAQHGS